MSLGGGGGWTIIPCMDRSASRKMAVFLTHLQVFWNEYHLDGSHTVTRWRPVKTHRRFEHLTFPLPSYYFTSLLSPPPTPLPPSQLYFFSVFNQSPLFCIEFPSILSSFFLAFTFGDCRRRIRCWRCGSLASCGLLKLAQVHHPPK